MLLWWIVNIVLLVIIFFLFLLLSMFWPPDSPWAPWWRTNKKIARAMCRLAKVSKKDIVYDLGCGDGTALIIASKEFKANGVGIEIDPLRFIISNLMIRMNRVQDKVEVKRKNFYDVNISRASVVFVYLVPRVLKKLIPKFLGELKKGTLIVSYRYKISLPLLDYDIKNDIYLYKVNSI